MVLVGQIALTSLEEPMPDTFQSILIGGAAGLLSAIITHFSTRAKIRLDLAAEYDKKLQESRLDAYKELWAMLEPLARYGRDGSVTYAVMRSISDRTRSWYFQKGGIFLTERSRKPYFKWKEAMQPVLDASNSGSEPNAEINAKQLELILATGSTLRTALSDDIGTKRLSRV
jgi:hypothetical protein